VCRLWAEDFCSLVSSHILHINKIVKKGKLEA
jgi:hypothetical protein